MPRYSAAVDRSKREMPVSSCGHSRDERLNTAWRHRVHSKTRLRKYYVARGRQAPSGLRVARTVPRLSLEQRFHREAEKWDHETAHLSSPAQRFAHPSYVAILGMAEQNRDRVIDLLLRDLQQNRREWFWALSYLTHENPIPRSASGRLDKMIKAWVEWGKEQGRI